MIISLPKESFALFRGFREGKLSLKGIFKRGKNDVSPLQDPDVQKAEFLPLDQYFMVVWRSAMVTTSLSLSTELPDEPGDLAHGWPQSEPQGQLALALSRAFFLHIWSGCHIARLWSGCNSVREHRKSLSPRCVAFLTVQWHGTYCFMFNHVYSSDIHEWNTQKVEYINGHDEFNRITVTL